MSPKEQSQALVLLRKLYERTSKLPRPLLDPEDIELLDDVDKFLNHDDDVTPPDRESHGKRRG